VDVGNLQKWLAASAPYAGSNGPNALNNSGYILYFSDRRGNRDAGGNETGEFGNEDMINPASGAGTPNGVLDAPEDVNGDGVFRTYGATPHPIAVDGNAANWYTAQSPITPLTRITASRAQKNSVVFFRHALRLVNGTLGNLPPRAAATAAVCTPTAGGFTVAAENPVYVWGDYNASGSFNDAANQCHVPAAVIGDVVTLLSNAWADSVTFNDPTVMTNRPGTIDTWYRTAVIGGKNLSFPRPGWGGNDAGTDGGTHNFLQYVENWNGTLHYLGAMVSFYIARQGTGIYKCCNVVYNPPTRDYAFDTDFSNIGSLPPGTPHFTDVNALSYQQAILSTQ
jgi:hypothetical protein